MRKKIVAGNWKMNKNFQEGVELAMSIQQRLNNYDGNCLVVLIPPFVHITKIRELIHHPKIKVGGQNCHDKPSGAYTGEVSAEMLNSAGADYVIIGHSERRQYYGETNQLCYAKINQALDNKLIPIYCVGETLEERKMNLTFRVIEQQMREGVLGLDGEDFKNIVIAYEPVWAIGTGLNATKEQAQEVHAFIRQQIENQYSREIAQDTTILYGGSCKPTNAVELFSQPDVDGGLIGGASLNTDDFVNIILANQ